MMNAIMYDECDKQQLKYTDVPYLSVFNESLHGLWKTWAYTGGGGKCFDAPKHTTRGKHEPPKGN